MYIVLIKIAQAALYLHNYFCCEFFFAIGWIFINFKVHIIQNGRLSVLVHFDTARTSGILTTTTTKNENKMNKLIKFVLINQLKLI